MKLMNIFLFAVLLLLSSKAPTMEADFCVDCSLPTAAAPAKVTTPIFDIAKKTQEDFNKSMVLDPELVENMDSRQLAEMVEGLASDEDHRTPEA